LVTGGGGFLGGGIANALHTSNHVVRSFSRQRYKSLDAKGIEQMTGDLADADAVDRACAGMDVVFHVAAKAGVWGPHRDYYRANVIGTRNVIHACRRHGIDKLVFTSSPSVVHTGEDLDGVNESAPMPHYFEASYPATKAQAEKDVLAANDESLATVALRPHLIWGPGDNHLFPRLVSRVRQGKFRLIGAGQKLVDVTFIDNAVHAHLLAAERLHVGSTIAGKAYFISDGEPVPMARFINQLLDVAGLPPVQKRISKPTAQAIAWLLELAARAFNLNEPRLTRFLVSQFSTAHWFDISAARRDLGYAPVVTIQEGLKRMAACDR
jgi:nucleoside-diphosphate-sugar epimerase